jgi:hypothetical protein
MSRIGGGKGRRGRKKGGGRREKGEDVPGDWAFKRLKEVGFLVRAEGRAAEEVEGLIRGIEAASKSKNSENKKNIVEIYKFVKDTNWVKKKFKIEKQKFV